MGNVEGVKVILVMIDKNVKEGAENHILTLTANLDNLN